MIIHYFDYCFDYFEEQQQAGYEKLLIPGDN